MPYLFGSKYVIALLIWIQIYKCPSYFDPNIYKCSPYLNQNMLMLYLFGSYICKCLTYLDQYLNALLIWIVYM